MTIIILKALITIGIVCSIYGTIQLLKAIVRKKLLKETCQHERAEIYYELISIRLKLLQLIDNANKQIFQARSIQLNKDTREDLLLSGKMKLYYLFKVSQYLNKIAKLAK